MLSSFLLLVYFPTCLLLNLLLTEGEKRPSEDRRGGLVFLPSVRFPVCRWEDVKTVAAAFSQRCSFLTPGNNLRCHIYTSWLVQGVCVKRFFFLSEISLLRAAGPFFQFPPPFAACSWKLLKEGSLISPHTSLLTREMWTFTVVVWLVTHLVSESSTAQACTDSHWVTVI